MKIIRSKKIQSVFALFCLMALLITFTACGGKKINVKFDYNYEGADSALSVEIAEGEVVAEPTKPTRDRYEFDGWYPTQAANGKKFDFEEALYEDTTVYAGWKQTIALITFDYNYTNGGSDTKRVNIGEAATQPSSPSREGYLFNGWYTDAAVTSVYDFSTLVKEDMTLYAGWEEATGDTVTLTYQWNYEGAPDNGLVERVSINKNTKTKPYSAVRENYYLAGWYTDAACTQKFDFDKRINESATLYAKWLDIYTFEAEYVDYTGMIGNGYSGNQSGVGLIVKQKSETQQASNGHYAGWMYRNGNTLTFRIHSDKAVTDAVLTLRLSAEFYNMTLTDDTYLVQVNGTNLKYSDIVLSGVPEQGTNQWRTFTNYTITTSLSLNEGDNEIKLIINNDNRLGESGTMYATAPLTDCIYIYTDAVLTWNPLEDNLNGNIS